MQTIYRAFCAFALSTVISSFALATHDLGSLGTSMPAYTGSAAYTSTGNSATLDYAVFAPGDFTGAVVPANHYVYAYQGFVNTPSNPMFQFSVFVDDLLAANKGAVGTTSGTAPFTQNLDPAGTKSFFNLFSTPILAAGNSKVVYFTSPNSPKLGSTSAIFTAGPSAVSPTLVPTPLPEPATIGLLTIGALILGRKRRLS